MTSEATKRGPGRPKRVNPEIPPRTAGRIGAIWDTCVRQAKADGQSMTAFVEEAITRELARRQRRDARKKNAPPASD